MVVTEWVWSDSSLGFWTVITYGTYVFTHDLLRDAHHSVIPFVVWFVITVLAAHLLRGVLSIAFITLSNQLITHSEDERVHNNSSYIIVNDLSTNIWLLQNEIALEIVPPQLVIGVDAIESTFVKLCGHSSNVLLYCCLMIRSVCLLVRGRTCYVGLTFLEYYY